MSCKPRVIAAEVKKDHSKDVPVTNGTKPHIAGELALVGGTSSEPHWVEVRDGHLLLFPTSAPDSSPVWRLPLRHLNLQPAPSGRPRGFSLTHHGDSTPIATFQVDTEAEYSRWVRTLAAELLKQTPLEAVKYLDILGITANLGQREPPPQPRSLSPECHSEPDTRAWTRLTADLPLAQPLSLVITEEPRPGRRRSVRKALDLDRPDGVLERASPDAVDGRLRMVDSICRLAKQSKSCFRPCGRVDSNENLRDFPSLEDGHGAGAGVVKSRVRTLVRGWSQEPLGSPPPPLDMKDDGRTGRPPLPDVVRDLPPCDRRSRPRTRTPAPLRLRGKSVDVLPTPATAPAPEDGRVAELIARCQREDRYVPVKDKRLLFESLGRTVSQPRFVLSSDNLTDLGVGADLSTSGVSEPPRTRSLHDLTSRNVAVKEICRYFEQRGGSRGELVARSPSPECRLRLHVPGKALAGAGGAGERRRGRRLDRLQQATTDLQDDVWRLRDRRDKLALRPRGSSRLQDAVELRLQEERAQLKRLQDELYSLQHETPHSAAPDFGLSAVKVRHHSDVR